MAHRHEVRPRQWPQTYDQEIEKVSEGLNADTFRQVTTEAEVFARKYFIERSYQPQHDEALFSLDTDYCGT